MDVIPRRLADTGVSKKRISFQFRVKGQRSLLQPEDYEKEAQNRYV
jgi:hypothetical protein